MQQLDAMRIFARLGELCSFTQTAESLGLPKASITNAIQQLEARLNTRLFHRSTRKVQLTQDGLLYLDRVRDLLADLDELDGLFQDSPEAVTGRLRVDLPAGMARGGILRRLPEFLSAHPRLELELSCTDRRVDLIREGFDCVVRVGAPGDPSLIARPLGRMPMVNCGSPAYLAERGVPTSLEDLQHHRVIHYVSSFGRSPDGWEYFDGTTYRELPMQGRVTVNNSDAYLGTCLAGLGLIQTPRQGVQSELSSGTLVEVLPDYAAEPMPVNFLYPTRRHLPRRVKLFMEWVEGLLKPQLVRE